MKKKQVKKLKLNKQTISNLSDMELQQKVGGMIKLSKVKTCVFADC